MSEKGGGFPKQPQAPNVELISRDMNGQTIQLQGSYNRYGQLIQFNEGFPSDDEQGEEQTQDVGNLVNPIASLHHSGYDQGTEDWENNFRKWKDIGKHYRKCPKYSLSGILVLNKPLPPEELKYFQEHGIKFEKELGSGNFATVWLVTKTEYNHGQIETIKMACKIMNLKSYKSLGVFNPSTWLCPPSLKMAVGAMIREIEVLRKLINKNIVKCEYVFKIHDPKTGFPYCRLLMFMELCDGDLLTLIEKSPGQRFTEEKAKYMLRQVSDGLQYMHDKHICHLDIKPENILYVIESGAQLIYKLSDLGLSIKFDSDVETFGRARGTPYYMAPEVCPGKSYLPKPADIYALGCVLWQTVVGQAWWIWLLKVREVVAKTPWDRVSTISNAYKISKPCADLILRMTYPKPDKRPTIGELIKDTWLNTN